MIFLLSAIACAPQDADSVPPGFEGRDLRLREGDYPDPGDANAVWWGPEVELQPGEDVMHCVFGTYHGPDQGVHGLITYQNAFGHHLVPMGTTASELDYPDGTVVDCTQTGSISMTDLEPIVVPNGTQVGDEYVDLGMEIPDGMAVKLDEGQRFVMQGHWINTGTEPILAKDVAVFEFIDPAEVDTWAAQLVTNHGEFSLPPQETSSVSFDCTFDADYTFVYMLGHMHEWGRSLKVEEVSGDTVRTVYEVPAWDPVYRDQAPVTNFTSEPYSLAAGTTLRTTCEWFNDTDEPLEFPHEMCVSVSLVYPLLTTNICDGGNQ